MFFNKDKPQPPKLTPFEVQKEYAAKLDNLIADALAARVDFREFARTLESRAEGLRMRWATTAPVI
jgi:hypothetical protein